MEKFIFGLMILVSMLGIVGCANSSDSDDTEEEVVYTVANATIVEANLTISYKLKSEGWSEETTLAFGESFNIKKQDAEITEHVGFSIIFPDAITCKIEVDDDTLPDAARYNDANYLLIPSLELGPVYIQSAIQGNCCN